MTQMLNIVHRSTEFHDPCYRYKMPRLETQVQGKSKRTVLLNLFDISKALDRDTDEIVKYLGCRLGVSTTPCSIKGEHAATTLQNVLQDYIESYILCRNCNSPETRYKLKRHQEHKLLCLRCAACGAVEPIPEEESIDRVNHFIKKAYRSKPRARIEEGGGGVGVEGSGSAEAAPEMDAR